MYLLKALVALLLLGSSVYLVRAANPRSRDAFIAAESVLAFIIDVLAFPTEEEACLVVIPWFILFLATWGPTISTIKYCIGTTASDEAKQTERCQCAVLASDSLFSNWEAARKCSRGVQWIDPGDRLREHRTDLQNICELACTAIQSKQRICSAAVAVAALFSSKKQSVEASRNATSSRILELNLDSAARQDAATSCRDTLSITFSDSALDKANDTASATSDRDYTSLKSEPQDPPRHIETDDFNSQRMACVVELARLADCNPSRKSARTTEIARNTAHVLSAEAILHAHKAKMQLAKETRRTTVAIMEMHRTTIADDVAHAASNLANVKAEIDELHNKVCTIALNRASARVRAVRAKVSHADNISCVLHHVVHARHIAIQRSAVLEGHKTSLATDGALAFKHIEDAKESLAFSIAEHRLHLEHCAREGERFVARLAASQNRLHAIRVVVATKGADVAERRALLAHSQGERHEAQESLELKLKLVSDGNYETHGEQRAAEEELDDAQWAYEDHRTKAIRAQEQLKFNDQLEAKAHKYRELRRQAAMDDSAHEIRLAALEERLAALRKTSVVRKPEPVDALEDESLSPKDLADQSIELLKHDGEFSLDGTFADGEDHGQDAFSCPATPALTYTSGRWSRSPTCSPVPSSPLPCECTAVFASCTIAADDDAASEKWAGAAVKLAEGSVE